MLPARAVENQVYAIGCNRVGSEEDVTLGGNSCIIAPSGSTLAEAGDSEETLVTADLDPGRLREARQGVLLRETMRPDVYRKLAET